MRKFISPDGYQKVPSEFELTDYVRLLTPPKQEKAQLLRAFQNVHKQLWLTRNALLRLLNLQQMILSLSFIMNKKKLMKKFFFASLWKKAILNREFQTTLRHEQDERQEVCR